MRVPLIKFCFTIFGAYVLWSGPAFAGSYTQAQELLNSGDYRAAQSTAQALDTGPGYALAAQAILAEIMLGKADNIKNRADEAVTLAEKAVALSPDDYDANVQYALAFGVKTRLSSVITAWRKKYPEKTFEMIEALRSRYPNTARGDALLGAWHLAVVRKAGEGRAEKMYGASVERGIAAYEKALIIGQQDHILIASNYAAALYVIDPERFGQKAEALLKDVARSQGVTQLDRDLKARLAGIQRGFASPEQAQKQAEDFLDGEPLRN